eukprot:g3026.t1
MALMKAKFLLVASLVLLVLGAAEVDLKHEKSALAAANGNLRGRHLAYNYSKSGSPPPPPSGGGHSSGGGDSSDSSDSSDSGSKDSGDSGSKDSSDSGSKDSSDSGDSGDGKH